MAADGIKRKDDRAVFEALALGALKHHENDPEFQRLLLHSALEKHELAQMFFDEFVRRVYEFLGSYIRERQREGAFIEMDPAIVVRSFIGMVMHHSLNNNLWDPKRRLLNISNESAAKHFTDILLNGITAEPQKTQSDEFKEQLNTDAISRELKICGFDRCCLSPPCFRRVVWWFESQRQKRGSRQTRSPPRLK